MVRRQERDRSRAEGRETDRGMAGRRVEMGREWGKESPGEEEAQGQGEGDGGEGDRGQPGTRC